LFCSKKYHLEEDKFQKKIILRKIRILTLKTDRGRGSYVDEMLAEILGGSLVVGGTEGWVYLHKHHDAQVKLETRKMRGFRERINLLGIVMGLSSYIHKGQCWALRFI